MSDHWIDGDTIYHDGNAVMIGDDAVKLRDGSAGWWMNRRGEGGYGSLAAVRIEADIDGPADGLRWGERRIRLDHWTAV